MKKIFIIFIFFFLIINKNAECQLGWFSYSYSYEFIDGTSIKNHSLGYETLLLRNYFFPVQWAGMQWVGIFIRGVNNNPALELKYEHDYPFFKDEGSELFTFGPGLNLSYSFNKNIFGISPQFDFMCMIGHGLLKFNLIYKYNFYIDHKNTHEIGLTVSLFNFPTLLFIMGHPYPLPETDE